MNTNNNTRPIKFISYDGSWPNLCSGTLTITLAGETIKFGYGKDYYRFWHSGGRVWFDDNWGGHVESGPWEFDDYEDFEGKDKITEAEYKKITELFSENVPEGCCGGCV